MRDGRRRVLGEGFSFSWGCRCVPGCKHFLAAGDGLPKITEGNHSEEANAYDAPRLKLMYGVIHVTKNGILNTGNAIEGYV